MHKTNINIIVKSFFGILLLFWFFFVMNVNIVGLVLFNNAYFMTQMWVLQVQPKSYYRFYHSHASIIDLTTLHNAIFQTKNAKKG